MPHDAPLPPPPNIMAGRHVDASLMTVDDTSFLEQQNIPDSYPWLTENREPCMCDSE